jgi:EAL domain-containing protein (putative c-di-GMP-specific phosphodiesterase class I)
MYRAKELGGNRAEIFDTNLRDSVQARFATADALHTAVLNEQLIAHYQPIMDIASNEIVAVEALARWQHPSRGLLGADAFIDVAEQAGLMVALGTAILTQACRDVASLNRELTDREPLRLAVNLSARQLGPGLTQVVEQCLASSGLDGQLLCLELTESSLVDDLAVTARVIEELRALGVQLSVDDFGTGYSSLLYLRRFPVTSLKIDRSFIAGLGVEPDDTAIVTGVIELARGLGLTAVAEGVETPAQLELLRSLGCGFAQGWLWSRAVSITELTSWIGDRRPAPPLPPNTGVITVPSPRPDRSSDISRARRA